MLHDFLRFLCTKFLDRNELPMDIHENYVVDSGWLDTT